MSLLDVLKEERDKARSGCQTCSWLDNQDPEVVAEIEDWIRDVTQSRKALLRVLQKHGLQVKDSAFRNHVHECVLKDRPCL